MINSSRQGEEKTCQFSNIDRIEDLCALVTAGSYKH